MKKNNSRIQIVLALNGWVVHPAADDFGRIPGDTLVFNRFEDMQLWLRENMRPEIPSEF